MQCDWEPDTIWVPAHARAKDWLGRLLAQAWLGRL